MTDTVEALKARVRSAIEAWEESGSRSVLAKLIPEIEAALEEPKPPTLREQIHKTLLDFNDGTTTHPATIDAILACIAEGSWGRVIEAADGRLVSAEIRRYLAAVLELPPEKIT